MTSPRRRKIKRRQLWMKQLMRRTRVIMHIHNTSPEIEAAARELAAEIRKELAR